MSCIKLMFLCVLDLCITWETLDNTSKASEAAKAEW